MSVIAEIWRLFPEMAETRAAWRAEGLSEAEIAANTERLVRHRIGPHVPPEHEWPPQYAYVRCPACEGTGIVMRTETNRLGIVVETGYPCRCERGARFEQRQRPDGPPDHLSAGKTTKRGFGRFGR